MWAAFALRKDQDGHPGGTAVVHPGRFAREGNLQEGSQFPSAWCITMASIRNILSYSPPPYPRPSPLPMIAYVPVPSSVNVPSHELLTLHPTVVKNHSNGRIQAQDPHWQLHRDTLDAPTPHGPCQGYRCCNDATHPLSARLPRRANPSMPTTGGVISSRIFLRLLEVLFLLLHVRISPFFLSVASDDILQSAGPIVQVGGTDPALTLGASTHVP